MSQWVIVVDVQECFLNDYTGHVPARVATLLGEQRFDRVLFTRFVNPPNSAYRVFLNWHGCETEEDAALAAGIRDFAPADAVYDKAGKTGLPAALVALLKEHQPDQVTLVGIDTDMCVLKIALDVFDLGLRPVVLVDCCASTAGLQAHLAGLAVLARNIGAPQLRLSGLDEGYLGRPPEDMITPAP